MEINLFECFAGVGSQHIALKNIAKETDKINIAGISEWDMYEVIANYKVNGYKFEDKVDEISDNEIREFFGELPYSLDSKKLAPNLKRQPIAKLRKLYQAHKKLGNIPDINGLKGSDIIERDVNLLTYSFPCQDLSNAGHRRGMSKNSDTRSGLLWQVERVLEEIYYQDKSKLPKYLLMENVTAIIDKNHRADYLAWKFKLTQLGYTSYDGSLDAKDFGIPQTRSRFFCISILDPKIEYDSEDLNVILDEYKISEKPNLANFLRLDYTNEIYKKEADLAVPNHTSSRLLMYEREKRLSSCITDNYETGDLGNKKYVANDIFTRTLTTKQDRWNNGGMHEYYECKFCRKQIAKDASRNANGYSKFRLLTNREMYLLMGFTEEQVESILEENMSRVKMYRQAGNSIVIPVLEAIFKGIIQREEEYLDSFN